ncbi:hypothetical protein TNIN_44681 [Trichonephila inaurata madagascariensis]|uniref:Uncharacterized protein n=1 Tax=Trichonephila inaurata madagascariensis TaxID=2747483 RepID=A0A8X6YAR8_9ARAC|nr:hypothetical protein TNIN_44681 [Trichonephila inaurata madagascariensis]
MHYPCHCRRRPVSSPRFHWRPPDDYRPTNITTYSTWNEAHSRGPMVGADNDTARNTGNVTIEFQERFSGVERKKMDGSFKTAGKQRVTV